MSNATRLNNCGNIADTYEITRWVVWGIGMLLSLTFEVCCWRKCLPKSENNISVAKELIILVTGFSLIYFGSDNEGGYSWLSIFNISLLISALWTFFANNRLIFLQCILFTVIGTICSVITYKGCMSDSLAFVLIVICISLVFIIDIGLVSKVFGLCSPSRLQKQ